VSFLFFSIKLNRLYKRVKTDVIYFHDVDFYIMIATLYVMKT